MTDFDYNVDFKKYSDLLDGWRVFSENNENKINQNANMDEESFGGRFGEASSYVCKQYGLNKILPERLRHFHENNLIYVHDLDHLAIGDHNCLTVPLDQMLSNGFSVGQVTIRQANSFSTAVQLVAVIFQTQSLQQFGGVSAGHLDWTLVPFLRKSFRKHFIDGLKWIEKMNSNPELLRAVEIELDKQHAFEMSIENESYKKHPEALEYAISKTKDEVHQGVEALLHNLNSLMSRSGNQLPFSSINFGTCCLPEGRIIIDALLTAIEDGIGIFHTTSIFPCVIFQLKRGINLEEGEPNYDLFKRAIACSAKRIYPNYANCDCTAQRTAIESDRKMKQEVLNGLSETEKKILEARISRDPRLAAKLSLKVVD